MAVLLAWVLALAAAPLAAQPPGPQLDFLDDRLVIPEAALFDSAQYRTSGAEVSFAEGRRLYALGQYPQAAQHFAQLSNTFPHQSAVWVYLARAFFHTEDYPSARQALARGGQLMPDLEEGLWQPLGRGLETEVRRLANQLQAQVDYYPQRQADFVPLIQLYQFLQDSTAAAELVAGVARRRADLFRQAEVAAGTQRQSYLEAAGRWDALIGSLNAAWGGVLAAPGPQMATVDSLKSAEVIRLLQLRVNYYLALPGEYRQLFGEYLRQGRLIEAAAVVQALENEGQRLGLLAAVAPTPTAAAKFDAQIAAFQALGQELKAQLPNP